MSRRRVATLVGAVGTGALAMSPAADAVQFGSTATQYITLNYTSEVSWGNNSSHTYSFYLSGGQAWIDAFRAATRDAYHNPTDLQVARVADSQEADVRILVGNWGTNYYGWASCPSDGQRAGSDPWESCYKQVLKIDLSIVNGPFWDSARKKSLACHEFGHTVGLRHDNDSSSCMTETSFNPFRPTLTDQDEWDLINFLYV